MHLFICKNGSIANITHLPSAETLEVVVMLTRLGTSVCGANQVTKLILVVNSALGFSCSISLVATLPFTVPNTEDVLELFGISFDNIVVCLLGFSVNVATDVGACIVVNLFKSPVGLTLEELIFTLAFKLLAVIGLSNVVGVDCTLFVVNVVRTFSVVICIPSVRIVSTDTVFLVVSKIFVVDFDLSVVVVVVVVATLRVVGRVLSVVDCLSPNTGEFVVEELSTVVAFF